MDGEELRMELSEIKKSTGTSFRSSSSSSNEHAAEAEYALQWAEIQRLPTFKRLRSSLVDEDGEAVKKGKKVADVTKLGAMERHLMIENLIKHIENDNLKLLKKIRKRMDRVGVEFPSIEVRYEHLSVEAKCEVVEGKALPTLWNSLKRVFLEMVKLSGIRTREAKIRILNDVNGIINPGRLTLLLGPPGCGKTTLLKALSGNLDKNLKRSGEISYSGHQLNEFVPQKTSAYISQQDLHIAEMTVRETIDFSARCQGVASRTGTCLYRKTLFIKHSLNGSYLSAETDIMMEVSKRENDAGIIPDPEVDAYMKAISVKGLKKNLQTDYILKVLGLDICAETLVGNAMKRGISGGQKKRLTTAEMIVGPTKALFMDEITNGLDSSTAFQIVKSLQQLAHITDATVLVSLLQPAPESYDLFDDIVLMDKGKIVYHGPRDLVLNFFEECGFRCPERKGVADFLQEVISKKDQRQYWMHQDLPYRFVPVDTFSKRFKDLEIGRKLEEALSKPYDKSKPHKDALSSKAYSLPKWELFRACISREFLLMKRNYFVYLFKTFQLVLSAIITMTVFIRTRMGIDIVHGNSYMSCLFFGITVLMIDGIPEISMTVQRLAVFYKQKQLCFYPAWAYAIPATVLKVPLSFIESLVWTCLTYYVIGYTPEVSRFLRQFIMLFAVHFTSISMFRCIASIFQTGVASMAAGSFAILATFVFAGFAIPYTDMPGWLKWGFWVNPISYAEIGLSVNEFLAPRWQQELVKLSGVRTQEAKISILNDVSGIINPGRLTLLLGPPGCGKTTLLKALSGNLDKNLKVSGEISYNGQGLNKFVPQKTSAYISQNDLHIAEMTVRETIDFSARCQGVASRTDIMMEVIKREKDGGIIPDPEVDAYMKAISVRGLKRSLQTDYILKILGLDICAETLFGNAMRRGISGGQKKRLTTAEMIVGPTKALFMDEITNGLDSSTALQIVKSLQQLAHITDATVLVSLLQPAPESYDLFDDIVLMDKGKIVYHGPRDQVLSFFEECGFRCPERKGVADFLQEVISRKDQGQYWLHQALPYSFVSVETFSKRFKDLEIGRKLEEALSKPYDRSKTHNDSLSFNAYSLPNWELFRACLSREFLLMKRNYFVYLFDTFLLILSAILTMTVFIRTRMGVDIVHGNSYMSCLFFATVVLLVNGAPELNMTVERLAVFYKQKQLCFYPAWAYAIPATVLKVPLSFFQSLVWTCLTYYVIGYTPEASRFLKQFIMLFAVHFTTISMFRCIAGIFQTGVASMAAGGFAVLITFVFAGFAIPYTDMPGWLKWGFWVNPISYAEIGLSVNEFLAPRWQQMLPTNVTLGRTILESRGLNYDDYMYWVCLSALFGLALIYNTIFTLALSFLKSPTSSRAMISHDKLSELQGTKDKSDKKQNKSTETKEDSGKMVLPFKPLTITFQDLNYYVDVPVEMRGQGYTEKKLQLLSNITGAFRPGVLRALMGISGAGKTTLLDVLAGRKTSGYIEGDIRISGYRKVQETFARVSGYCEQTDIHSPNITVEESLIYSAWLRLVPEIDPETKIRFVKQVLETIELEEIKDALVGVEGESGLSTEQRKRLTVAVELVANPSIIFMDEPTTGLDARAAAIVMRAVKNVAETGRTIVCTIHQPSIDIFEAFDELVLLKTGGRMIYTGPLGQHSSYVIKYFESIPGVSKIKDNYNPATWMLEVTSQSIETELNIDFSKIYNESDLSKSNSELVKELRKPDPGSTDLHFDRTFAQSWWGQFKSCLWKMSLSYWRSPSYNLMRIFHTLFSSLIFGLLFWKQGHKIDTQQNLFTVLGAIYGLVLFLGVNNCATALQYFETERNVMYRERFAGMYSAFAYALAQLVTEIPYIFIQSAEFVIIIYPRSVSTLLTRKSFGVSTQCSATCYASTTSPCSSSP
ncbi:unnamed protein product [Brassica napus]|uniref:(rape) hypothetical protein n=1 Tax=Brassica napus TaxID=3708 RepID=A0A816JH81_BRANA|nr:unnamed protein product [Brassica napus]